MEPICGWGVALHWHAQELGRMEDVQRPVDIMYCAVYMGFERESAPSGERVKENGDGHRRCRRDRERCPHARARDKEGIPNRYMHSCSF